MKRSEMIEIMLQTYTMYLTAGIKPRETFELMLEHMEEAGMLPPPPPTREPWTLLELIQAWEPEDER